MNRWMIVALCGHGGGRRFVSVLQRGDAEAQRGRSGEPASGILIILNLKESGTVRAVLGTDLPTAGTLCASASPR